MAVSMWWTGLDPSVMGRVCCCRYARTSEASALPNIQCSTCTCALGPRTVDGTSSSGGAVAVAWRFRFADPDEWMWPEIATSEPYRQDGGPDGRMGRAVGGRVCWSGRRIGLGRSRRRGANPHWVRRSVAHPWAGTSNWYKDWERALPTPGISFLDEAPLL